MPPSSPGHEPPAPSGDLGGTASGVEGPARGTPGPGGRERAAVHRQPVVGPDSVVRGYAFHIADDTPGGGRPAQAELLVHAEYDALDFAALTGGVVAFVRATTAMLTGRQELPQVPGGLVLEVPPRFTARPDAEEHLAALRSRGVGLALGDYRAGGYGDALLTLVDYVKVDLGAGRFAAAQAVRRAHAAGLAVIAERVDTEAAVDFCAAQGVDLLQGPLFALDTTTTGLELSVGQLQCLELMQLLSADPVDQDAVVAVVRADPELAMRVLRLVNLVVFAVRREVDSVHQAVVLVGPRHLATLAMTSLLDARARSVSSLWFVLGRALACRTLGGHDGAYTVGLLSAVAAQLRLDPMELVRRTGVSSQVADALRDGSGPWGPVLAAVVAHEADDDAGVRATGLPAHVVADAYLDAVAGAFDVAASLTGAT